MSNLILDRGPGPRRTTEIELAPIVMLAGKFTWELIRDKKIIARGESDNIITNALLDDIGTGNFAATSMTYCGVGSGNTAPAATQTDLATPVFRTNRVTTGDGASGTVNGPPRYTYYRKVYLFIESEANGNLAEMGIFKQLSAGTMMSRQLFKNSGGVPVVITKTAADQLRITYEYRVYSPTGDANSVITISGVNYTVTRRPLTSGTSYNASSFLGMGNFTTVSSQAYESNALFAESTNPPNGTSNSSITAAAYTNGNYYRDVAYVYEPGVANFTTGIGLIRVSAPSYQFSFSTQIPKDSTKRLTLNVRHSWARYP